ncbi:MAG: hypothetical protein FJ030_04575 [Chloroflexi bacterium]|nr:hypothetical protein [Chloroflexota bacterium]
MISTPERDVLRGPDALHCPKAEHVREWNRSEFARYLETRGLEIVEHRLLPDVAFNFSRDYFDTVIAGLKRGSFATCQMAVCQRRLHNG